MDADSIQQNIQLYTMQVENELDENDSLKQFIAIWAYIPWERVVSSSSQINWLVCLYLEINMFF